MFLSAHNFTVYRKNVFDQSSKCISYVFICSTIFGIDNEKNFLCS